LRADRQATSPRLEINRGVRDWRELWPESGPHDAWL